MNKLWIVLVSTCLLLSCSDKDVEPDWTTNFVGTWKTEVQHTTSNTVWTTYTIRRINNKLVSLLVSQTFMPAQGEIPDYVDTYQMDSVSLNSDKSLLIDFTRKFGDETFSYNGTGSLEDEKIEMDLKINLKQQAVTTTSVFDIFKQ